MEINDLIDEHNDRLYQTLSKRIAIALKENPDWRAESWDSYIRNGTATLLYCDCLAPTLAFTKELLRIQARLNGFKPLVDWLALNDRPYPNMQTVIKSLNHHFLSHKIARDFVALGYSQEQFLEEDHSTAHFLKDQLLTPGLSPLDLSILYLLFIEPSAMTSANDRAALQGLFSTYGGGEFTELFQRIDKIINNWTLVDCYDAEEYIINFLTNAGLTDAGFSYESLSHEQQLEKTIKTGFLVGKSFDGNNKS